MLLTLAMLVSTRREFAIRMRLDSVAKRRLLKRAVHGDHDQSHSSYVLDTSAMDDTVTCKFQFAHQAANYLVHQMQSELIGWLGMYMELRKLWLARSWS